MTREAVGVRENMFLRKSCSKFMYIGTYISTSEKQPRLLKLCIHITECIIYQKAKLRVIGIVK